MNDKFEALMSQRWNWLDAIYAGDSDKIVYFLTTDAYIVLPNQMIIKGSDSIRKWLKATFEQFQCRWLLSDVKRQVKSNRVFEAGTFHLSATSKTDAATNKSSWSFIILWRLTEGENWKVKICVADKND